MEIKKVQFKNKRKEILKGFLHIPKKINNAIILLHGFPGDCSGHEKIAKSLSRRGHLTLRFNFGGTANSEGKFENKLMSKESEEIKSAIDFILKYNPGKIVVAGFSTGAIDISLYAHKDKRIDGIVLVGGVSNLKKCVHYDFNKEQIKQFKEKGFIVYNNRPKNWTFGKKIKKKFYDEFFKLDIKNRLKKYKKPLLIVHGERDKVVPPSNAKEIFKFANKPKKLVIIRGGDHSFKKRLIPRLKLITEINKFVNKLEKEVIK